MATKKSGNGYDAEYKAFVNMTKMKVRTPYTKGATVPPKPSGKK